MRTTKLILNQKAFTDEGFPRYYVGPDVHIFRIEFSPLTPTLVIDTDGAVHVNLRSGRISKEKE